LDKNWLDKKQSFEVIDVRTLKGNFLPSILKKAQKIVAGGGLCIVQSFEPIPLYSAHQGPRKTREVPFGHRESTHGKIRREESGCRHVL
jgi:hypothetical protein